MSLYRYHFCVSFVGRDGDDVDFFPVVAPNAVSALQKAVKDVTENLAGGYYDRDGETPEIESIERV